MLLLAIDTSAAVSAAVLDGTRVLAEALRHEPRGHAEVLAPAVAQVLREAGVDRGDLDAVAVGVGPGPFTGLRVGLVTARTLGLVLEVPVHGVCSLDALALQASEAMGVAADRGLVVATDARRREVYWARYRVHEGWPRRVDGPHVSPPGDVRPDGLPVAGRGALLYPEQLPQGGGQPDRDGPLDARAGHLGRIAASALAGGPGELLAPEPLYLRRPDAREPAGRKPVLQ